MSRVGTGAPGGLAGEAHGDIVGPPAPDRSRSVMRHSLRPWEEAASLRSPAGETQETLAPLTRFLGAGLTVASPAWGRDPMPGLRGLQKRLVGYSLTLPEDERDDSMAAILVVEQAVQWRLRIQQMESDRTPADEQGAAA